MKKIILTLALLFIASHAYAISYDLTYCNDLNVPSINPYGTVTIVEDGNTNVFTITVDANDILWDPSAGNTGIDSFFFQY